MRENKISVIIVSWNARDYLRKCLISIRETFDSLAVEIIVVDNASTDGSPEMVTTDFPEVILVRSGENLGFSRANNLGINRATGRWLALVNSDVVVHPGCFQRLSAFLESEPKVGLVGPKILGGDGLLQRSCRRLPNVWNTLCRALALDSVFSKSPLFSGREMRHWSQDNQAEVEVLSGCFWVARREAVQEVGGLDERFFFYAEDVDWCKRFWDANWKVMFVPTATATHFGGGSSVNAPLRYNIQMLRANLEYWRKHWGLAGQAAFYLLSVIHHGLRLVLRGLKVVFHKDPRGEAACKLKRSQVCLRWLLTAKEVSS
jgi:GT2 family glycosyltransferase